MSYNLRAYQAECLESIAHHLQRGVSRLLVACATGLGKTVVFAHLPAYLQLQGRWLVLAHRQELLQQAAAKFQAVAPELSVGIEQGSNRAGDANVIVASVPTLQGNRLHTLPPSDFAGIICDEAHHATAPTYRSIFDHFPGVPLVGFTATPHRGDSIGLSSVFEEIAYEMSILDGIRQGYLSPLTGWRINTDIDISKVKTVAGDFTTGQLAAAVNTPKRNLLIVRQYMEKTPTRKAIAFCVDVKHAEDLAAAFAENGVSSSHISGKTPPDVRQKVLGQFKSGELRVITNCGVLTEGYDEPSVSCIIMARPTRSSLLYTQIVGRGTRLFAGKENCVVLDFSDSSRHTLCSVASLLGLPPKTNLNGRNHEEIKKTIADAEEKSPWLDLSDINDVEELKHAQSRIDFFSSKPPEEIRRCSSLCWYRIAEGGYRLSLPGREHVEVTPTRLDKWHLMFYSPAIGATPITEEDVSSLPRAMNMAEDMVRRGRPESVRLLDRSAAWRKTPASEKQLVLLRKMQVPVPEGISKGQAASIITMKFAERGKK